MAPNKEGVKWEGDDPESDPQKHAKLVSTAKTFDFIDEEEEQTKKMEAYIHTKMKAEEAERAARKEKKKKKTPPAPRGSDPTIWAAFCENDIDDDGFIGLSDIRQMVRKATGEDVDEEVALAMIGEAGGDNDRLSYNEFAAMIGQ